MWWSSVLLRLRPDVLFVEGEAEHIVCNGTGCELCRECSVGCITAYLQHLYCRVENLIGALDLLVWKPR